MSLAPEKAAQILRDGGYHDRAGKWHWLTERQKRFFHAVASGRARQNPFAHGLDSVMGEGAKRHPFHDKRPLRGLVLYEGPSPLGGTVLRTPSGKMGRVKEGEIVLIATLGSENKKTGNMIQTWIILKDVNPQQALLTGQDSTICGFCPHRAAGTHLVPLREGGKTIGRKVGTSGRSCYVNMRYVSKIWQAYHRGIYRHVLPNQLEAVFRALGRDGFYLRVGSYGDPAAVPMWVWEQILGFGSPEGWTMEVEPTCYTHQWAADGAQPLQAFCMASVDSVEQQQRAETMGWRTFRVGLECGPNEILCPASDAYEAIKGHGSRRTCEQCRLCCGGRRRTSKSIFIPPHGGGGGFASRRLEREHQNPGDEDSRAMERLAEDDGFVAHRLARDLERRGRLPRGVRAEAVAFFWEEAGYATGKRFQGAVELAAAEVERYRRGWHVRWELDPHPVHGDGPPVGLYLEAALYAGEDHPQAVPLAVLGSVNVVDENDPYMRVVEAELAQQVLASRRRRRR